MSIHRLGVYAYSIFPYHLPKLPQLEKLASIKIYRFGNNLIHMSLEVFGYPMPLFYGPTPHLSPMFSHVDQGKI